MSDLSYNQDLAPLIVNNGSNYLKEALDKLNVMEGIALRQRHKIETIKYMLESRLNRTLEKAFIKELLEEINNE